MVISEFAINVFGGIADKFAHLHPAQAIIFDIGLLFILAAIVALVAKMFKQPLIPAYILTGLIIGPLVLGLVDNMELIVALSEIGIAFLLFTAGLEISFKKIKEASIKRILIIGTFQITLIFLLVFLLKDFLSLSPIQAGYLGVILAFGSSIVDVKLLADSGELSTLHGRLALGILLFEDLVAIIAIVIFTTGGFLFAPIVLALFKLLLIVAFAILLQKFVLDRLFKFAARSNELLFLSALAVLFMFTILSFLADLSIVIGAFIAGISLANSSFKTELESKITPLRDFFAILFFVSLGTQIVFEGIASKALLFGVLLSVALFIKPFIAFILLRITGHKSKTSFFTAISLAKLSEFALIIGMLGVTLGVLDTPTFSTVILATIITMSLTPYLMKHKEGFYSFFAHFLNIFKFLPVKEHLEYAGENNKEIILIGAHRMGSVLLKYLLKEKNKVLVIDYNPKVIKELMKNEISCIYGDITGPEIISKVSSKKLKKVISTVPKYEDNLYLLNILKKINPGVKVIVTCGRISEAKSLYDAGAEYVITPKISAGEEITRLLSSKKYNFKEAKKKHLKRLKDVHKLLY